MPWGCVFIVKQSHLVARLVGFPKGCLGLSWGCTDAGSASDNPWASFDEGSAAAPSDRAAGLHTLNPLYEPGTQPTAPAGALRSASWTRCVFRTAADTAVLPCVWRDAAKPWIMQAKQTGKHGAAGSPAPARRLGSWAGLMLQLPVRWLLPRSSLVLRLSPRLPCLKVCHSETTLFSRHHLMPSRKGWVA